MHAVVWQGMWIATDQQPSFKRSAEREPDSRWSEHVTITGFLVIFYYCIMYVIILSKICHFFLKKKNNNKKTCMSEAKNIHTLDVQNAEREHMNTLKT